MIPVVTKSSPSQIDKPTGDNFKNLCSEKHIGRLYRAQMSYLKANWKDYDICDSRAIQQILDEDWKECLKDYHSGKLDAERILEKSSHRSIRGKGLQKTASAIFHSARTFFSSCCGGSSFTSRIDTTWGPRGLANEGCDCFLNALFQEIMWGDEAFRNALCARHPVLEEYVRDYEEDKFMSLYPLRSYLSELSKDDRWLSGQHDPDEAMMVLTKDWKENPHQMEVVTKKIYSYDATTEMREARLPSIALALSVPAGKSSLSFEDLLENFHTCSPSQDGVSIERNGIDLPLRKEINRLESPGDHLTFQILRSSGSGVKSHVRIDIPKRISLSRRYFINKPKKPIKYELTGFTLHKGSSSQSGHYVAYTSELVGNTRKYFVCNDSRVKELSEQEFLKAAQSAYLLYFKKIT